ncbi:MAG: hypothetical protein JW955_21830 [Sedimentisphaerales bacterium]|nr:hypothetical protein [Sedimentisphaerales bacterium]
MQRQGSLHLLLFVVFFSVGAAALGAAVLCDDFTQYCQNKGLLQEAQTSVKRLESLNAEYDALLQEMEKDPNLLQRIVPVTLGTEPNDPNTAYPRARASELAIARRALLAQAEEEPAAPTIPVWLQRCSDPPKRIALFIAGASLVLISMVCFTSTESAG